MKPEEGLEFQVFVDGNEVTTQAYYSHLNRYRFASRFVKDKVCLDVGCGTGYGSAYLIRKGAKRVVGGDKSEEAIAYARNIARTVPRERLEFSLLEATSLPFGSNSFDAVVCFEVIEHVKDCARLLSETQRILRRGGKLILSTPNGQAGCIMFKLPYHVHDFSKSELLNLADRYFDPVMYGQCFLNKRSLILRRPSWTTGRLLELVGLRRLRIWLGKLLFRYNQVVVYKTKDFDNLVDNEWEVMPLSGDLTPSTFVVVATKS